jgi:hypothetical protein
MKVPTLLHLATTMMCFTIALAAAIPAQARSDWQVDQSAPQWFDQTVYRPHCLPADCVCDCPSERLCPLGCVQR